MNEAAIGVSDAQRIVNAQWLGGYQFPVLDWISRVCNNSEYQILKTPRPYDEDSSRALENALRDPNTVYGYPEAGSVRIIQFDNWDNRSQSLEGLGIDINLSPKLFKRVKTFNRPFRAFHQTTELINIMLIADDQFSRHAGEFDADDLTKLFDGAFIISPDIVEACLQTFDLNDIGYDFGEQTSLKNIEYLAEIKKSYQKAKVFNTRIFGSMNFINEGEYLGLGALKGQAYMDLSGACEYYGVDVIAPFSAFKPEINIHSTAFFLIEPQNAKIGQMFSDGQTIANMPALYQWKPVFRNTKAWFEDTFEKLTHNEMLEQWSSMSFTQYNSDFPKFFDQTDVNALTAWNVRAWLMCGGKLTDSPWLFSQMGQNVLESAHINDRRRLRFPVPCAVRAIVVTESLLRALKGLTDDYCVDFGTARWDEDFQVLVVNDWDYVEMYESHGGCDLDDFFQVYWRTIAGERKIVICRSPNDWGEYSIFDYVEGDWFAVTEYLGQKIEFPKASDRTEFWADRLSDVLQSGEVTYTGLPEHVGISDITEFNADYVLAAVDKSSASATSVGINVNARQLWSDTMMSHRAIQTCSMEDGIDAGVQGGSDDQVKAVIDDGNAIVQEIIASQLPVDRFLWETKHADYNPDVIVPLKNGNITYLHDVRSKLGSEFAEKVKDFASRIAHNANMDLIHELGMEYLAPAVSLIREYRKMIATASSKGFLNGDAWSSFSDHVIMTIESYEPGHDRNSFMISLYSACFKLPTSYGKITDQFVMQPTLFPVLLEALQFYGILASLKVSEFGQLTRVYETQMGEFTAVEYQRSHFKKKKRESAK